MSKYRVDHFNDGTTECERYYLDNYLHRLDGPAEIYYHQNGLIKQECYYINGLKHRHNEPALISYYENGCKEREVFFFNDLKHNINGPASIYYEDNKIKSELYCINGQIHREDGPAFIQYFNGIKPNKFFYYKDKFIKQIKTLKAWKKYVDKQKLSEYFDS